MKNWYLVVIILFFGLPFLGLTDLFPLHRFGMFALVPTDQKKVESFEIQVKNPKENWKTLQTGNEYFDKNYFPVLASRSFYDKEKSIKLGLKINNTLIEKPDSIRIISTSGSTLTQSSIIYPK
jgi:hypothetical protein